jgi:hypothetical protein
MAKIAREDFFAVENCARARAVHFFGIVCACDYRRSRIFVMDTSPMMPN